MFPKVFDSKPGPKKEILPPNNYGKIVLIVTTAMQLVCLVFAMCGHGKWVEGDFGYSGLWRECKQLENPYKGTTASSCYDLKMRDSRSAFNTARIFYILSHFFGAPLFILIGISIIFFNRRSLLDFIKLFLALGQWGLLMLGTAMTTAVKNNEGLLSLKGSHWEYGCVLAWFSWSISCLVLLSTVLFIILSRKFRED